MERVRAERTHRAIALCPQAESNFRNGSQVRGRFCRILSVAEVSVRVFGLWQSGLISAPDRHHTVRAVRSVCSGGRGDQAACFEIARIPAIGQASGAGKTSTARTSARFDPGSLRSHKAQAGRVAEFPQQCQLPSATRLYQSAS